MAITFNKKSWKSRISEHPTRRRLTIVDQSLSYSLVDVARDEGTVEQVGDTFDKSTMDDMENRIENIAITAQAECDGLQEQIDALPSLDDTKAIDIGWKESGTRNVAGDTIKVNNYDLYMGEIGKQVVQFGRVYGSTSQRTSPAPSPSEPAPINGVGVQGANNTWTVSKTVNGCTATVTLPYPLYEGDYIDFDSGVLHRANGYQTLNSSDITTAVKESNLWRITFNHRIYTVSGDYPNAYSNKYKVVNSYSSVNQTNNSLGINSPTYGTQLVIRDDTLTSLQDIKDSFDALNLIVTYPLATATDTQVTVKKTGKNFFDISQISSGSASGVDYNVDVNTGVITVSGEATGSGWKILLNFNLPETGTYHFHLEKTGNVGTFLKEWSSIGTDVTVNCTDITTTYRLAINSFTTGETYEGTISKIQVEKNSQATSYEPYGIPTVIRGFIPSHKFFQMGRKYTNEEPVKTYEEELNDYFEGFVLNVDGDRFVSTEQVDKDRVNEVLTMYGYDYDNDEFLTSVSGEILTATGKITCDLVVTDIWGCGANNATERVLTTEYPISIDNRNASNSNGFPIELRIENQSQATSLVVGSPVFFRITGELYILLWMGTSLKEYTDGSDMSQFYEMKRWIDTRDGMHYQTHYIEIEKGSTFNLSDITTSRGYNFLLCSVRTLQPVNPQDYLEWTVTDSNVAITAKSSATGYAEGLILEIDHRRVNDSQGQYDTHESIIVKTIPAST